VTTIGRERTVDLDGPVHFDEYDGDGPDTVVLVHGLGGSALNWMRVAPALSRFGRVLAPELGGHGRTSAGGQASSVTANRELLDRFLEATTDEPVMLMGNSMGGAISLLEAAASPERIASLVLVDPALPTWPTEADPVVLQTFMMYATPGVGEEFVRTVRQTTPPEALVAFTMQLCCADWTRIPPDVIQAHVDHLKEHGLTEESQSGFLEAARTLLELLKDPERVREAAAAVRAPTLVVAGDRDRLVPPEAIRAFAALRPDWRLEMMPGVGHVPMLEDPEGFRAIVEPWLEGLGAEKEPKAS